MAKGKSSGGKKFSAGTIAIAAVGGAVVGGLAYMGIAKMMAAPSNTTPPPSGQNTTPGGQVFLPVPMGRMGKALTGNVRIVAR